MPASCAESYLNRFKSDFKLLELDKWILFVSIQLLIKPEICFIKFIWYVPTNWTKVASLLNQTVEETKPKKKSFEVWCLFRIFKPLRIRNRIRQVRSNHICFHSLWCFICHFNTILKRYFRYKYWNWEFSVYVFDELYIWDIQISLPVKQKLGNWVMDTKWAITGNQDE